MQPKIICRNATTQQADIFSRIKSAQSFDCRYNHAGRKFTNFDCIKTYYKECPNATLIQHSEHEFTLQINSQVWINFSTEQVETIALTESISTKGTKPAQEQTTATKANINYQLTRRQKQIILAMKQGAVLWHPYIRGSSSFAYLVSQSINEQIKYSTVDKLVDLGLIEEIEDKDSDVNYKIKE